MGNNWFTIKKLFPTIWGIAEFKHSEKVISYLFVGEKQALLFDSGMGINDIYVEIRKITSLPIRLINSHSHYDHTGGNKLFTHIIIPSDGEILNLKPFIFNVINTPGHTIDSICLYEKNKKILLTGDTMYPGPIYLFFPDSDFRTYKKSIQKLVNLNIDFILPSHNSFFQNKDILNTTFKKIKNKTLNNRNPIRINDEVILLLSKPKNFQI